MKKVVLSVVLFALLAACGAAAYRQFVLLPHARAVLTDQSTNPAAAQFREEVFIGPWSTAGFYVYCAQANLPNRAGGYDGFRDVIIMSDKIVMAEADSKALASELCGYRKDGAKWWWLRM